MGSAGVTGCNREGTEVCMIYMAWRSGEVGFPNGYPEGMGEWME